jgi:hypothetical protein
MRSIAPLLQQTWIKGYTVELGTITSNQALEFQKGYKRSVAAYTPSSGDRKQTFRVKQNWTRNAANDGISTILDHTSSMIP